MLSHVYAMDAKLKALSLKVCKYITYNVLSAVWSVHSFHFMSTNTLIRCTTGCHTSCVKYFNNGLNGTVFIGMYIYCLDVYVKYCNNGLNGTVFKGMYIYYL